ncbi:MAG: hypothetical protein VXZ72_02985 [Chlamydiota bacterium]|nr:hypothetical protein [Chlamydiota bacterium]
MTRKQKLLVRSQCRSVERLAEAVERINGIDVDFAQKLSSVKEKMQSAKLLVYEEGDDTEIIPRKQAVQELAEEA